MSDGRGQQPRTRRTCARFVLSGMAIAILLALQLTRLKRLMMHDEGSHGGGSDGRLFDPPPTLSSLLDRLPVVGESNSVHRQRGASQNSTAAILVATERDNNADPRAWAANGNARGEGTEKKRREKKNAYVFLMAGVDPASGSTMGYVWHILISNEILKSSGSDADVVVLVRMAAKTTAERLPPLQAEWFERTGVRVKYLPRQRVDNFYTAVMDKFRVLELTEYDRALFLDTDLMPICNLDYIFDASYSTEEGGTGLIRPHTVLAYNTEPANSGFFLIRPSHGSYKEVMDINSQRDNASATFNVTEGWGHQIRPPDHWESLRKKQTEWDFQGSYADQGLLYHWVKYVKYDHSQIRRDNIITWRECNVNCTDRYNQQRAEEMMQSTKKEEDLEGGLLIPVGDTYIYATNRTQGLFKGCGGLQIARSFGPRNPPFTDFVHFTGPKKPWLKHNQITQVISYTAPSPMGATEYWYYILEKVKKKYNITYDIVGTDPGRPPLGMVLGKRLVGTFAEDKEALAQDKVGRKKLNVTEAAVVVMANNATKKKSDVDPTR